MSGLPTVPACSLVDEALLPYLEQVDAVSESVEKVSVRSTIRLCFFGNPPTCYLPIAPTQHFEPQWMAISGALVWTCAC
jgi:hypothetical protein